MRDFFDRSEAIACKKCPLQTTCSDKFKLPNSKFNAGTRDVFQVLLAYGEKAQELEQTAPDMISEDQLADDQPLTAEQEASASQYQMYGLRMKDALIVLQAFDEIVSNKLEGEDFFEEKFAAAISLYENEAGIDKYSLDIVERKRVGSNQLKQKSRDLRTYDDERSLKLKENDDKLKKSFPGNIYKGELTQNQRTYLKKFDENVSAKPIPDTGSKQLPKKRVKGGDNYVDSIKKQAGSTVAGHFLKEFKPQAQRSQGQRRPSSRPNYKESPTDKENEETEFDRFNKPRPSFRSYDSNQARNYQSTQKRSWSSSNNRESFSQDNFEEKNRPKRFESRDRQSNFQRENREYRNRSRITSDEKYQSTNDRRSWRKGSDVRK